MTTGIQFSAILLIPFQCGQSACPVGSARSRRKTARMKKEAEKQKGGLIMSNPASRPRKVIADNRSARHEYELLDRYEAGLELKGTEIKSIRKGKVQLKDSYISIRDGQAVIKGMHIAPYEFGNRFNHEEVRDRRLLLHKKEILKLDQAVRLKGFTLVPVSIYLVHGLCKLEIAVARGKNLHDKRESAKKRDAEREIRKAMKERY